MRKIAYILLFTAFFLLLSCESGLNRISIDGETCCIVSSECTYSHKLHRIGRVYIDVYYNDSICDSYMIQEKDDGMGKGNIYLRDISKAYVVKHWHDRAYLPCSEHQFRLRPHCKYKITNATHGRFPQCTLYMYTDSHNNLYEDSHPYESEME